MCQIIFIQLSVEVHFSCFLALAIVNNVAMNTGGARIFENKRFQIFLVLLPEEGLLGLGSAF